MHALVWRIFHSFVLGAILKAQSQSKWLVRHFVEVGWILFIGHATILMAQIMTQTYHYEHGREDAALEEAFTSWKQIYTMSLYGTYGTLSIDSVLH
jgi:phosphatidylethanolamine N-methyltransferase